MTTIKLYTKQHCPYCVAAKDFLRKKKLDFVEIAVDNDPVRRQEMESLSQRHTVPQIFINDKPIGGYTDLYALHQSGEFEKLLHSEPLS